MAVILVPPFWQFEQDGIPLDGGKIYTYSAGTSTPKATYTTAGGGTELPNPIELDTEGRAVVFGDGSYKFVVTDADDNILETIDNVTTFNTIADAAPAFFQSFSGTGSQTDFTLSTDLGTDEKALMIFVDAGAMDATGYQIQNPNAYTVDGTALTFSVAPASGTNNIFVFAPSTLVGAASASAEAAAASATAAAASALSAQTAETNAETAETNAETAEANAEAAQAAAEAAQAAAEAAQAAAEAAQAAAETAETNAETAETNAEAAQAAAEAAAILAASTLTSTSSSSNSIGTGNKTFTTQANKQYQTGQFIEAVDQANNANFMWGQVVSYSGTTIVIDSQVTGGSGTISSWYISVAGARGATGGGGTVTSVAMTGDNVIYNTSVTGSPVTTSGTLVPVLKNQTANTVFAGPSTGAAAPGTMRSLVAADLPNTAVTPGSYTSTNLTVDAQGRITAASNGTASSGWVPIATKTAASDATIDFVNGSGGVVFDSTYKSYAIDIVNVKPSDDGVNFRLRTSSNGGSSYDAGGTDYDYAYNETRNGGTNNPTGSTGTDSIRIENGNGVGNSTGEKINGILYVFNPAGTDWTDFVFSASSRDGSSVLSSITMSGSRKSTSDVDALRFYFTSGNIASGTFTLYGLASA